MGWIIEFIVRIFPEEQSITQIGLGILRIFSTMGYIYSDFSSPFNNKSNVLFPKKKLFKMNLNIFNN